MSHVKLIAIDIDGTLLNSHGALTPRTIEILKEASQAGVKVVLCSGRPYHGVKGYLKTLDLIKGDQYVVSYNGSLVQTADGKTTIQEYGLSLDDFVLLDDQAKAHGLSYTVETRDDLYVTSRDVSPYVAHESDLTKMMIKVRTAAEILEEGIDIQKMLFCDEPEKIDAFQAEIPQVLTDRFFIVKSAPFYLEVLNPQATKGNALAALCDHLGLSADQVMAIGDNYNDLAMLEFAGESVAMGNAVADIQNRCKHVTLTNDQDGVAHIVEKLVLEK